MGTNPKRECPWCHEPKSNLYGHAKVCTARPEGAELPLTRKRRARKPRASTALAVRTSGTVSRTLRQTQGERAETVDDVRGRMEAALADLQTALRVLNQYAGA